MNGFLFELRHSLRTLMHRPAFALTAMLTLALGVGANTAMFSAIYHTLIAPLPFADGDRFAYVWRSSIDGAMSVSPEPAHVRAWRESGRLFEAVEPYHRSEYQIQFGDQRETLPGLRSWARCRAPWAFRRCSAVRSRLKSRGRMRVSF